MLAALSVGSADASRYWEETRCFSLVGQTNLDGGYDVNGNGRCNDREVLVDLDDIPQSLLGAMLAHGRQSLCTVVTAAGEGVAFLGYAKSGEFRGLYHTLNELPDDGTVFPGGLNGDGDCNDQESVRANFTDVRYFALGDSVASGHGLMDDGSNCRRSIQSYPYLVAELLRTNFDAVLFPASHHLACSGATAAGGQDSRSFQAQVEGVIERLDDTRTIVSITIGANDFDWSDGANFSYRLYWQSGGDYGDWLAATAIAVENEVLQAINRLLEFEHVNIVVTEYHNPFNSDSVFFLSPVPGLCAFRDCYGRTEEGVQALNAALTSAVANAGDPDRVVVTSGLHEAFGPHNAPSPSCGNDVPGVDETWVQYRTDPDSNSFPGIANWFGDRWGDWRGDCFHPNFTGAKQFAYFTYKAIEQLPVDD